MTDYRPEQTNPKPSLLPLPDVHFGAADTPLSKGSVEEEPDPDDDELAETPSDVVAMLGFDPLDMDDTEDAEPCDCEDCRDAT